MRIKDGDWLGNPRTSQAYLETSRNAGFSGRAMFDCRRVETAEDENGQKMTSK